MTSEVIHILNKRVHELTFAVLVGWRGARSPSSRTPVGAVPASAGQPGGARLPSSRTPVAAAPASAEPAAPAVFPLLALTGPTMTLRLVWLVTASQLGLMSRAFREERSKYNPPQNFENQQIDTMKT